MSGFNMPPGVIPSDIPGNAPKRRGGKPGVKLGPRVGSRPWALSRLEPGESLLLEAPPGRTQAFMQQIASDIHRTTDGGYSQALILGVSPSDRSVVDIVRVTRDPRGSTSNLARSEK